MPTYTKNYNAIKPKETEQYDVKVANSNNDLWDKKIFEKQDKVPGKELSTNDFTNKYKKKLDALENYDDTEIKKNIEALQTESKEKDILIENLKAENNQLLSQIPTGKPTPGEHITLKDSSNLPLKSFNLKGKTVQETIEEVKGKIAKGNIISVNDVELDDGRIGVFGRTEQETREGYNLVNIDETFNLTGAKSIYTFDKVGTYTFYIENAKIIKGTPATGNEYFLVYGYKGSTEYISRWVEYNKKIVLKIPVTEEMIGTNLQIFSNTNAGSSANITTEFTRLMLLEGEYTTETAPTWEPYGAMPSPPYPSELRSCGDDVNIFDITKKLTGEINSDGDLMIPKSIDKFYDYDFKENTQYTFSAYVKNQNTTGNVRFLIHYKDGTNNINVLLNGTTEYKYMTFTTEPNKTVDYISMDYGSPGYMYIKNAELKIQEGPKATPWSPFGCGNLEIKKCNKNLTSVEKGGYNSGTGEKLTNENLYRSTDFIKINNANYVLSQNKVGKQIKIFLYDKYYKLLSSGTCKDGKITIADDNASFFTWQGVAETFSNTMDGIQLEAGTTPTDSTEHQEESLTFTLEKGQTLDGLKTSDASRANYIDENGQAWTCDYLADDGIHKRIPKVVLDGTEGWVKRNNTNNSFQFYISKISMDGICSHYKGFTSSTEIDKKEGIYLLNTGSIIVTDLRFTELSDFTSYLVQQKEKGTPVTIKYELKEEEIIPYTETQKAQYEALQNLQMYIPTTNIFSDSEIEPGLSLKYNYVIPKPSLERPSEVRGCGDNINLFNKEKYRDHSKWSSSGGFYIYCPLDADDLIKFKQKIAGNVYLTGAQQNLVFGLSTTHDSQSFLDIYRLLNRGVISSKNYDFSNSEQIYLCIGNSNKISSDRKEIDLIFNNYDIKLEEGTIATPYSPFGCGNISIIKTKHNMLKPTWAQDLLNRLSVSSTNTNNCITEVDGHRYLKYNASLGYNTGLNYFVKDCFKPNTQYTLKTVLMLGHNALYTNICFKYTDEKISNFDLSSSSNMKRTEYKITSNPNKTLKSVEIYYAGGITYLDLDQTMLYEGTEDLEWEDYAKVYVIPTQKPFKAIGDIEDTFIKQDGKWYESHSVDRKYFIDSSLWYLRTDINNENTNCFRAIYGKNVKNQMPVYCNYLICDNSLNDYEHIKYTNSTPGYAFQIFLNKSDYQDILTLGKRLEELNTKGVPLYVDYILEEPELIPCTEEQNTMLDEIESDGTFKNITYFFSEDEIQPVQEVEYYKDIETEHKTLQTQIDEIKALLSTTSTSAMLLDNYEKDLIEEV